MLYRDYISAIFYRSYIPLFDKTISKKCYVGIYSLITLDGQPLHKTCLDQFNYSRNSFKGGHIGNYVGDYDRGC